MSRVLRPYPPPNGSGRDAALVVEDPADRPIATPDRRGAFLGNRTSKSERTRSPLGAPASRIAGHTQRRIKLKAIGKTTLEETSSGDRLAAYRRAHRGAPESAPRRTGRRRVRQPILASRGPGACLGSVPTPAPTGSLSGPAPPGDRTLKREPLYGGAGLPVLGSARPQAPGIAAQPGRRTGRRTAAHQGRPNPRTRRMSTANGANPRRSTKSSVGNEFGRTGPAHRAAPGGAPAAYLRAVRQGGRSDLPALAVLAADQLVGLGGSWWPGGSGRPTRSACRAGSPGCRAGRTR